MFGRLMSLPSMYSMYTLMYNVCTALYVLAISTVKSPKLGMVVKIQEMPLVIRSFFLPLQPHPPQVP